MSMFKSLLDEHQAKQSRLKEEVGACVAAPEHNEEDSRDSLPHVYAPPFPGVLRARKKQ